MPLSIRRRADQRRWRQSGSGTVEGNDGHLYGVTRTGGPNGTGVVFRVSRDGAEFASCTPSDRSRRPPTLSPPRMPAASAPTGRCSPASTTISTVPPRSAAIRATARSSGCASTAPVSRRCRSFPHSRRQLGAVHELEGASPLAGLTDGGDGRLYGVANLGGEQGNGTVFSIDPGAACSRRCITSTAPRARARAGNCCWPRTACWSARPRPVAPMRPATSRPSGRSSPLRATAPASRACAASRVRMAPPRPAGCCSSTPRPSSAWRAAAAGAGRACSTSSA